MTGSLGACAGHCGVLVDAAPSRGDDYIALDLARGMRQKRTSRRVGDVIPGISHSATNADT